jgi:alpha-1,6-mannosyltransferase
MVAAEARASGIPMIVPDRGAAADQLLPKGGSLYRAGSEISLGRALDRFMDRGPELQRAAAARACQVRTMDEHFADLFARYAQMVRPPAVQSTPAGAVLEPLTEVALARAALRSS